MLDLLFKRYASPFSLLDTVLQTGSLSDFIDELFEVINEEQQWDYFLAKVFDKSFNEFKEDVKPQKKVTKTELRDTVNESMSMLDSFVPY